MPLRNERRDERMHVRVQLPFDVNFPGKRLTGHDISVSGLSTVERPPLEVGQTQQCEIDIRCNGFRAVIPAVIQMLGTRPSNQGGRYEIVQIGHNEASILRRLIRARLAGVHLTLDQLAAHEDPQTVRERVKKTVQLPNPDELINGVTQAKKEGRSAALLRIKRSGEYRFVALPV